LRPVYGLSLVDDIFHKSKEMKNTYYHHYSFIHNEHTGEKIEGLELVFIELPKFKANSFTDKKLRNLWLRFLTEIDENTKEIPEELLNEKDIREALDCVEKSAFTEEELQYYDTYWDAIRIEKAAIEELTEKNQILQQENEEAKQREEEERRQKEEERRQKEEERRQKEEERRQKEEERRQKEQINIKLAIKMKRYGESIEEIIKETKLSKEEIEQLENKK